MTTLPQTLEISCPSDVTLGCGYNAVTHSFTGNCALADTTTDKNSQNVLLDVYNDIKVIDASSSMLSITEVGFGLGSQVNLDVKLEAKYKTLVSRWSKMSTVILKCWRMGTYDWEIMSSPPSYRKGVNVENPKFFVEYGDYYVSATQRVFGYWVVIVFRWVRCVIFGELV